MLSIFGKNEIRMLKIENQDKFNVQLYSFNLSIIAIQRVVSLITSISFRVSFVRFVCSMSQGYRKYILVYFYLDNECCVSLWARVILGIGYNGVWIDCLCIFPYTTNFSIWIHYTGLCSTIISIMYEIYFIRNKLMILLICIVCILLFSFSKNKKITLIAEYILIAITLYESCLHTCMM